MSKIKIDTLLQVTKKLEKLDKKIKERSNWAGVKVYNKTGELIKEYDENGEILK